MLRRLSFAVCAELAKMNIACESQEDGVVTFRTELDAVDFSGRVACIEYAGIVIVDPNSKTILFHETVSDHGLVGNCNCHFHQTGGKNDTGFVFSPALVARVWNTINDSRDKRFADGFCLSDVSSSIKRIAEKEGFSFRITALRPGSSPASAAGEKPSKSSSPFWGIVKFIFACLGLAVLLVVLPQIGGPAVIAVSGSFIYKKFGKTGCFAASFLLAAVLAAVIVSQRGGL